MVRRTVEEEETIAGQKIYRTDDGWFVTGLPTPPLEHDTAAVLAELLSESPSLARINAKIVAAGGKPIPPRRVSEEALDRRIWPPSVKRER